MSYDACFLWIFLKYLDYQIDWRVTIRVKFVDLWVLLQNSPN